MFFCEFVQGFDMKSEVREELEAARNQVGFDGPDAHEHYLIHGQAEVLTPMQKKLMGAWAEAGGTCWATYCTEVERRASNRGMFWYILSRPAAPCDKDYTAVHSDQRAEYADALHKLRWD